jgi:hypothetical protein
MVEGRALSDVNLGQVAVMCEYAKALFASGLRPAQIGFCLHGANNRIALRQLLEPVVLEELGGNPPSDSDHPAIGSYATFRAHNFSREVILMSNLHLTQPTSTPRRVIVEQLAVTMTLATRHFVLVMIKI